MAWHALIDCKDVDLNLCNNDKYISETLEEVALEIDADIISRSRYRFGQNSPDGCTVFLMLDESHLSVHTYSEQSKMAIDVFVSKSKKTCKQAAEKIISKFNLSDCYVEYRERFK